SQDLSRELAAAYCIECNRSAGVAECSNQVFHKGRLARIYNVNRADLAQDFGLVVAANYIHKLDAVLQADLVQHLAEVRGGRRMDERSMAFAAHGLGHTESR